MTRVYLPTTLQGLARAQADGVLPPPLAAHAVTAAVREWYTEGDLEELEYVAFTEAAEASLRLIADAPAVARRRVVIAVDVADEGVSPIADPSFRSAVVVSVEIPVSAVASVHVDEQDAETVIVQAVAALPAADAGDDDARFTLDEAEATELLWYDVSEIGDLI